MSTNSLIVSLVTSTNITEQGSEKEVTLENSQRQLEKDYEESSFESDSDDLNESEKHNHIP